MVSWVGRLAESQLTLPEADALLFLRECCPLSVSEPVSEPVSVRQTMSQNSNLAGRALLFARFV